MLYENVIDTLTDSNKWYKILKLVFICHTDSVVMQMQCRKLL
jgi:hypothetical protein